jgi:GNAT superfamily N-acetyltransferase
MIKAGNGGRIVNVASNSGFFGGRGRIAYGASKAGVINLTQTLAIELAEHGILVNAVAPGPTKTRDDQPAEPWGSVQMRMPLKRWGRPEEIAAALFTPEPKVHCDIAEWNGAPAGFAAWFLNFSTFRGRHGLYLEDLYVRPEMRGRGIGKSLMRRLAQHCVERKLARFEWAVLDWNKPSIAFYESIGAKVMHEWKMCRLTGAALANFARAGAPS